MGSRLRGSVKTVVESSLHPIWRSKNQQHQVNPMKGTRRSMESVEGVELQGQLHLGGPCLTRCGRSVTAQRVNGYRTQPSGGEEPVKTAEKERSER